MGGGVPADGWLSKGGGGGENDGSNRKIHNTCNCSSCTSDAPLAALATLLDHNYMIT